MEDIVSKMIFEALQIRENPDIYLYENQYRKGRVGLKHSKGILVKK